MVKKVNFNCENTVLFLGAGASKPYGLPLGTELKGEIVKYNHEQLDRHLRRNTTEPENAIEEFRKSLRVSMLDTVDEFLSEHAPRMKVGLYLIASIIARLESDNNLFYNGLYKKIFTIFQQGAKTHLKIITLNYDRSLEHFLRTHTSARFPNDTILRDSIEKLIHEILHLHGSLGDIDTIKYGACNTDYNLLDESVKSLRIIPAAGEDTETYRSAREVIKWSQNIIFLGFGYHSAILDLLLSGLKLGDKHFGGTAYHEKQHIKKITGIFAGRGTKISLGNDEDDCLAYLSKIVANKYVKENI
ncbi:MAG: SIR2 family protein [Planctomycetes bacterium]|nr:SIR2 family protein [Planctomycetota bacterium]